MVILFSASLRSGRNVQLIRLSNKTHKLWQLFGDSLDTIKSCAKLYTTLHNSTTYLLLTPSQCNHQRWSDDHYDGMGGGDGNTLLCKTSITRTEFRIASVTKTNDNILLNTQSHWTAKQSFYSYAKNCYLTLGLTRLLI